MEKPALKRLGEFVLLGAAFLVLMTVVDVFCPLRAVTGVPCPGCGLTRAWLAALRLDFPAAFQAHPLFLLAPALVLLALVKGGRIFPSRWANRIFWLGMAALFLGCYLWRMLTLFPDTPPMDYYHGSLLGRLLSRLRG